MARSIVQLSLDERRKAPWQKTTVDNTNRRVRRYLPPETIVLDVTSQDIRALCDRLNDTPGRGVASPHFPESILEKT